MGVTEVTVRQFREFVDASGHRTDAERSGGSNGYKSATNEIVIDANFNWQYTGFPQTEDHPVVNVSWNDAAEFCTWLSKKQGVAHRLPTEAEWEYACRAGSDKFFSHGDHIRDLEGYANLADAAFQMKLPTWDFEQRKPAMWNDGFAFTAPVKSFKPNAWGLYDMHGNVAEWCADWYDAKAYRAPNRVDPRGPTTGTYRIRRGSSWMEPPVWSAVADRWGPFPGDPALNKPEFRCINFGFRVVKVAP
jgi:formylglycine-generating enzyme required for sulfatase activity